jgi:hypothetical protein
MSASISFSPAATTEVHHAVPRCLLRLREKAEDAALDGEGIALWLEYEHEAMRYGVDPDVSRDELAAHIDASTVVLGARRTARSTSAISRAGGAGAGARPSSVTGARGSRSWP